MKRQMIHLLVLAASLALILGFSTPILSQCTDVDGDGYCDDVDCDDTKFNCTTDCTDADSDGFCVTTDCDDADSTIPVPTTSWWPGDGSASDVSGGNHGTLVNGTSFAPGVAGDAFSFEQVGQPHDDRIDLPHAVLDGVTDLTIEFWIRIANIGNTNPLISAVRLDGTDEFSLLSHYSMGLRLTVKGVTWQTGVRIDNGAWHHVAFTRAGPTVHFYLDGSFQASQAFSTGALDVRSLVLGLEQGCSGGCFNDSIWFIGLLDEFAVFDRALSATEILAIYDAGSAGKWGCTDCTDTDSDGYCDAVDCEVADPNCTHDCTDNDLDSLAGCADCDDANPNCTTDCTDADADGFCVTTDCDDSNANCTTDCTDADSDGYCVTTDCDETNPDCNTDCSDNDQDGLRVCAGDCNGDNPNCTTDCTDNDGDGFCVTTDCDDTDPSIPVPATSWWPGDGSASDVSGGNHGTLVNGVGFVPGVAGQAFSFDGVDDYVDFGDVLNGITVPFSIEAWIKTPGSTDAMGIFASDHESKYSGFRLLVNSSNALIIEYGDSGGSGQSHRRTKYSASTVPPNTWTHVAGVVRGPTDMSIYIDGNEAGGAYSGTGSGMVHTSAPARLGVYATSWLFFDGGIDEVSVFDWALTADEIRTIYEAGSAGKWCIETVCDGLDDNGNGIVDEGCDRDGDGYCNLDMTVVGSPPVCPNGSDCDDSNPNCTSDCTDMDADGFCVTSDCDETKPNCNSDCTDADSDDFCVTSDCDDSLASCTDDCTDEDLDGVALCQGDCDDHNAYCITDCTDGDGDTYCVTHDCDDTNSSCYLDCSDSDQDGFCVGGDCNDADPESFPGAPEVCDGWDNDCDSSIDDDPVCDRTCDLPQAVGPGEFVGDTVPYPWTHAPRSVSATWTGSEYGVAWRDPRHGDTEIYFARLDAEGTKLGGDVRVTDAPTGSDAPSLVWTGLEFGVAWQDSRDGNAEIYFARLDASGVQIGPDIRITTDVGASQAPSLVWTGQDYGLSWSDDRDGYNQIYFVRLDPAGGRIGSAVQLTNSTVTQELVSTIVWTGSGYGLAYERAADGAYFVRLDSGGNAIGTPILVSTLSDETWPVYVSMVWTGSGYGLVTNRSAYNAVFIGLDTAGDVVAVDSTFNEVEPFGCGSIGASISWTGTEYGIVWDCEIGAPIMRIYFIRFDASGNRIGAQVRLTYNGSYEQHPVLTWTGWEYGMFWEDAYSRVRFAPLPCGCVDADTDGSCVSNDCDDTNPNCTTDCTDLDADTYCVTHDCDDTFASCTTDCTDSDLDGLPACAGDCLDFNAHCTTDCTDADIDGYCVTHDCDDANGNCTTDCTDADADGLALCAGDCDDSNAHCTTDCTDTDTDGYCVTTDCDDHSDIVYPLAPQLCDGINNDCNAGWPTVPADESDDDADGFRICAGDCDDDDPRVRPGWPEWCNGIDDDCNGLIDDDANEDTDGDTVRDQCDNCPALTNPVQEDVDSDGVGDVCDNCMLEANPTQPDTDVDGEGDRCDVDDGLVHIYFEQSDWVDWDEETSFDSWNCYRGDLEALRQTEVYTQLPGSNPLALRDCGLGSPTMADSQVPAAWGAAYYLATGVVDDVEIGLGDDSSGSARPNDNPCP